MPELPEVETILNGCVCDTAAMKISKVLGYTSHIALNTYIKKRGLRVDQPM